MKGKNCFTMKFRKLVIGIVMATACMMIAACNQGKQTAPEDMSFLTERCEHEEGASCEYCMNAMLDYVKPAIVQLYCDISEEQYTSASGFIMEISETDIYICSNRHVVEGYDNWQVYFHDGSSAQGKLVGFGEQYDVAVVSVAVTDIATEVLDSLQSVYIDMEYWQGIGVDPFDVGLLRVDREGGVMHTLLGQVLRVKIEFSWGNGLQETELAVEQTAGDSGSAYFDSKGRLIAMVHGNSEDGGGIRNWGIPLDGIVSSYEEITGRKL